MTVGYIIERYSDMSGGYACRRLAEEGRKMGMDMRIIGTLDCRVEDGTLISGGAELGRADIAFLRRRRGAVRDTVCALAGRIYNSRDRFDRYLSKAAQLADLRTSNMEVPRYTVGSGEECFRRAAEKLGLPLVAKGLEGSRGDEIFLIESEDDFMNLSGRFGPEKEWLFEEYYPGSRGTDLRLFSLKGEAVACMRRTNPYDFRANYAQGASVSAVPITPEMKDIAEDVWRSTGLDIAGIDLLDGKDGHVFCEVNVMPGIKGIESCTGINIARACLLMASEDMRHGRA
ncbi:MAG: hypothetical protein LKJ94_04590 [Candidatus Methanomethylophilus sp.]|jgi:RimK family alpha-L-glutamate ligase|nr:hypothetical protein [Methanomethylophilus sp.]MCI2074965.1 hypothetical protein [Methanomethylophilus sp.]MCI2093653.1 hypothetical protein [Methanomethylophilus sp.]